MRSAERAKPVVDFIETLNSQTNINDVMSPSLDFRRSNGAHIVLKTNSGFLIPIERVWGTESYQDGSTPGENYKIYYLRGWIELSASLKLDKRKLEDNPLNLLIRLRDGKIIKYISCTVSDRPALPPNSYEENGDNFFGVVGYAVFNRVDHDDLDRFIINIGPYTIKINEYEYYVDEKTNLYANVSVNDNPAIKAVISIENVPRGLDRDGIWHDSLNKDTQGLLREMVHVYAIGHPIEQIHTSITVNGQPGFDLFISDDERGISAYRIGYWLGDNFVNVFATFTHDENTSKLDFKREINNLINSLRVNEL